MFELFFKTVFVLWLTTTFIGKTYSQNINSSMVFHFRGDQQGYFKIDMDRDSVYFLEDFVYEFEDREYRHSHRWSEYIIARSKDAAIFYTKAGKCVIEYSEKGYVIVGLKLYPDVGDPIHYWKRDLTIPAVPPKPNKKKYKQN